MPIMNPTYSALGISDTIYQITHLRPSGSPLTSMYSNSRAHPILETSPQGGTVSTMLRVFFRLMLALHRKMEVHD